MRVLLIEDDSSTARSIELALAAEGIICDTAEVGEEGVEIGRIYDYDIILLDLMLPDIDGYQVLLRLRSAKVKTPILILSGLSSVDQKVRGLGFGADDYLTKPFNKDELIARIQAIVRRSKGHSESVVRFDKVAINLDTRNVEVNGVQVHLTNKEYAILELLAMRKGSVLTKEMFLNHLYSSMDEPEIKIIDVFVSTGFLEKSFNIGPYLYDEAKYSSTNNWSWWIIVFIFISYVLYARSRKTKKPL